MIGSILLWIRRNTRKAVAVAIAPGLVVLAIDANIAHFMGGRGSEDALLNNAQWVPIVYSLVAAVLMTIPVLPQVTRRAFAWLMRILGVAGVAVGLAGTGFHIYNAITLLDGDYSWANMQGTLPDAAPPFAPLAFAGIGALLFMLPSGILALRLKVGTPRPAPAQVVTLNADERNLNSKVG